MSVIAKPHEQCDRQIAGLVQELNEARAELICKNGEIAALRDVQAIMQSTLDRSRQSTQEAEAQLSRIRAVIEPLREMEGRATKGPWRYVEEDNVIVFEDFRALVTIQPRSLHCKAETRNAHGHLIAALRNAFPAIVDALGEKP